MVKFWPPTLALVLGIALWEFLSQTRLLDPLLVPAPSLVAISLWEDRAEFLIAFSITAMAAMVGFLASTVSGLAIALLLASSRWLFRAFYPYAVFLQTLPIIAIAPLLVIWFGYGMPAVVASSFIVSIFPMIASSLAGLLSADPALRDLFKIYRANRWQILTNLLLPYSLPFILAGMRVAAALAVIGTIVGEFVGGTGLGSVIDIARTQQRIDKVFWRRGIGVVTGFNYRGNGRLLKLVFVCDGGRR